ncbi:hypothetical protein JKF63_00525 [Porcisia hertigi]|uniref:UDP-galactose transporter n=1 Tax=Porcisia hertigi TaxID=2761500 RepID=A0A836I8E9_9TRYP|nr:hypothetical protein JKF63_00525 [Porcisia hertigi]
MGCVARPAWLRCCTLNVNLIALVLLAVQNSLYLVLIGYSQQSESPPPLAAGGAEPEEPEEHAVIFKASHFLATTEIVKLLFSLLWCTIDEVRAMQKERSTVEAVNKSEEDSTERMPINALCTTKPRQPLVTLDCFFSLLTRMRHAVGLNHQYKETLLMTVPAIAYSIQGLLLIYALKLLDPALFQVLYQVRILFLAIMMRVVLDLRLSPAQWGALVMLMFGLTLAQLSAKSKREETTTIEADEAVRKEMEIAAAAAKTASTWVIEGTLDALAGGFLSAFSGVFMEFVLKKRGNHFSLAARNTHLAFFSVVCFIITFLTEIFQSDEAGGAVNTLDEFRRTFFDGFTGLVWFLVFLQAVGGMLVALVVRYCDNIVKSFSTAVAIVLSGTASVFLFNTPLNGTFVLGSCLVMISITVYSLKK